MRVVKRKKNKNGNLSSFAPEGSEGVLVRTVGGPMVLLTDSALDHALALRLEHVEGGLFALLLLVLVLVVGEDHVDLVGGDDGGGGVGAGAVAAGAAELGEGLAGGHRLGDELLLDLEGGDLLHLAAVVVGPRGHHLGRRVDLRRRTIDDEMKRQ